MRRPQPRRLRSRAQLVQQLVRGVVFAVQRLLVRIHVLLHEGAVFGTQVGELDGDRQRRRSTIIAMPWPPPTHIVSSPISLSSDSRSLSNVFMIRAPVMPYGWPSAIAPPCGLSLSLKGSTPTSAQTGSTCAANASFSSTTSTSSIVMPACFNAMRTASIGPTPMISGATPATDD